jgi:hypothetical protein
VSTLAIILTLRLKASGSAINHFAHVILTDVLLPVLKKTASEGHTVRIACQASNAHQSAPSDPHQFDSLEAMNKFAGPQVQYGRTK